MCDKNSSFLEIVTERLRICKQSSKFYIFTNLEILGKKEIAIRTALTLAPVAPRVDRAADAVDGRGEERDC